MMLRSIGCFDQNNESTQTEQKIRFQKAEGGMGLHVQR